VGSSVLIVIVVTVFRKPFPNNSCAGLATLVHAIDTTTTAANERGLSRTTIIGMATTKMQLYHGVFVVIIGTLWCFNIAYLDGEFHQRASMASRQQPAKPQQRDPHCGPSFVAKEAPPASSFQNYDKQQRAESATKPSSRSAATKNTTTAAKDFHIVFSTGCNAYQDCECGRHGNQFVLCNV
jgi:hypothetical protein